MKTTTSTKLNTINYLMLYVRDIEKSLKFYRDTLGMTLKLQEANFVEFDGGNITLALHKHNELPQVREQTMPLTIFQVDNIHQTFKDLKEKQIPFISELQQVCTEENKIGLSANFTDPDGNILCVFGLVDKK